MFATREEGQMTSEVKRGTISAAEILGEMGFSFLLAWLLLTCFWIFRGLPVEAPIGALDMCQGGLFVGIALGYLILHFFAKKPKFNIFSNVSLGVQTILALLCPFALLALNQGMDIPLSALFAINIVSGAAAAALITSWLDVLSRLNCNDYYRFIGIAFLCGTVLFAVAAFMSYELQIVFSLAYVICSVSLLVFSSSNAEGNDISAPVDATIDHWKYSLEVEPCFVVFGAIFGINFVFLFDQGLSLLFIGLMAIFVGALFVIIWGIVKHQMVITHLQRGLVVVAVLTSISTPFTSGPDQMIMACVAVAAWAIFKAVNYSFVVRKSEFNQASPIFRQIPVRLLPSSVGFALGVLLAGGITYANGVGSPHHLTLHLAMVVVLVAVVMLFLPVDTHHNGDGRSDFPEGGKVYSVSMDESELLERRCEAISKMYQLSPRESDILVYLSRGRNATWIREELVISPHTVKSHIYNIYRKLDIHSQQKLMSFVEEFPLN